MSATSSLRAYALGILARREISRAELKAKLLRRLPEDESPEIIEDILEEFANANWQSDQRYAESYIHSKSPRHGRLRLKHSLAQKGIDESLITEYLPDQESEQAHAIVVLRKKFASRAQTLQEKHKQMRFLAYRGFDSDTVRHAINNAWTNKDDETISFDDSNW